MQFCSQYIVVTYPYDKVKGGALLLALHYLSVVLKFVSMIIRVVSRVQGSSWDHTPVVFVEVYSNEK